MPAARAIITDGAGFIDSHLTELLLQEGWEVRATDDFSTGSIDNVRHLEADKRFGLYAGEAGDPTSGTLHLSAQMDFAPPCIMRGRSAAGLSLAHDRLLAGNDTTVRWSGLPRAAGCTQD